MIDALKLRCLQALNIQVWQPIVKHSSIPPNFALATASIPDCMLFVVAECPMPQHATVIALLQNIAFYLKLNADQYNVAFVAADAGSGISADALLATLKPRQLIVFGQSLANVFKDIKIPMAITADLSEALHKPLLKKQILNDLISQRVVAWQ